MRTNSKGGTKSGSIVSRVPRRRTKAQEPVALPTVSEESVPIPDQIARLAYFLWEARGKIGGSAEEDWYRAEQEILARSRR